MNRRDRRKQRKLARHATPSEIFPDAPHAPIQGAIREQMLRAMDILKRAFPAYDVTLFLAERALPAAEQRLPRFNYASTAEREDMVAVLDAFITKNRADADKVDMIKDVPPTETAQ